MKEMSEYSSIRIKLASPELIKSWSYGEVKKAETMNYRNLRPEKDGLFCERIFGTTKEWECVCGKFKTIRYKGVKCERCGVEVTSAKVRRERMGHINLASPVSHIWFYRTNPSRISLLLGINKNELHSVLYYQSYIVIYPGDTDLKKCQVLTESEYNDFQSRFGEGSFRAEMGAEAIRELLAEINLDDLAKEIRDDIQKKKREYKSDSNKRQQILKRLEIVENLKSGGNRPEWMILTVLPVTPPDLRPMLEMEGGRYGSSDINDLYRRVINRSNRLKRLIDMIAPDIILKNEKRMLQEAVDNLIDNNANKRTVKGSNNRPLKSLSDMLKGKQGRFRLNLLGKRVDFSGRSVIVIGPELRMHQCGLPSVMALELFKPFLYKKLIQDESIGNMKKAKSMVEEADSRVWEYLDEVVREHPVLLNRAPTLHRLSIQAFEPVLVSGKTIKLHPLVCHAYNADFDGDQMSVHVPLTIAARIECWTMLLSTRNLLDPANGNPIAFPSQDMVLGIYYLTKAHSDTSKNDQDQKNPSEYYIANGRKKYFDNVAEIYNAIDNGSVGYHDNIVYRIPETGEKIVTTPGRVIFNDFLPDGIEFQNKCFGSKQLKVLIADTLKNKSNSLAVRLLDDIKDCGFKYATKFGATISMSDIAIPSKKAGVIDEASKRESEINGQFRRGVISRDEKKNKVVDLWHNANEELSADLMEELKSIDDGFNPLFMMVDSGSRGSKTQISQLGGMRGLMSKPSGEVIDFPIKSNFKEGLSIIEFFISTNGARKGLADTALKTSRAGHLTRRLVDVSQDVVITQEDCGTINGVYRSEYKKDDKVIESLSSRIAGCYSLEDVFNPVTHEKLVGVNEEISDEIAIKIEEAGIERVLVRSVLTCEAKKGLCKRCYGRNLANNRPVDIGESVGVVAAQSIGQPGTQLTMRTFHTGGTASTSTEDNRITFKTDAIINFISRRSIVVRESDGVEVFSRKGSITYSAVLDKVKAEEYLLEEGGTILSGMVIAKADGADICASHNGFAHFKDDGTLLVLQKEQKIEIKSGSELADNVKEGCYLETGETLVTFDPFSEPIIVEKSGKVEYKDIHAGSTMIEELIEESGEIVKHISDKPIKDVFPSLIIRDEKGNEVDSYPLPGGSTLQVDDGQDVHIGDILAKLTKSSIKTKDITGGLPRIEELVEARRPSDSAVLAHISGIVHLEGFERSNRVVTIEDAFGKKYKHLIPQSKHLLVRDKDRVEAAEKLCDGMIDPHDYLDICGENELREYLVNQIKDVYREQEVDINEKHCGIIVRQMLKKVRIIKIGDTNFVQNQFVDKKKFMAENARVEKEGGVPAVAAPLLQGITRSSLSNSFIAAASFQETSKVLTDASIAGSIDRLDGLKENVVVGQIIPAGTGMRYYREGLRIDDDEFDDDELDEKIRSAKEESIDDAELADMANISFEEDAGLDSIPAEEMDDADEMFDVSSDMDYSYDSDGYDGDE